MFCSGRNELLLQLATTNKTVKHPSCNLAVDRKQVCGIGMTCISEFNLSRVQAEGWNTARAYLVSGDPADVKRIAALNPYETPLERSRWFTGFNSALIRDERRPSIATAWARRASVSVLHMQKDA
jgi:hypothetical protein